MVKPAHSNAYLEEIREVDEHVVSCLLLSTGNIDAYSYDMHAAPSTDSLRPASAKDSQPLYPDLSRHAVENEATAPAPSPPRPEVRRTRASIEREKAEEKRKEKEGACVRLSSPLPLCACAETLQTSTTRSGRSSCLSPAHRCSRNHGRLSSSRRRWPRCCLSSRRPLQRIAL